MNDHFSAHVTEPQFPERLRGVPECFFVEAVGPLSGALDFLSPAVAIVGTRSPPDAASRYTRWFAAELARRGVTIVSGGAYGIDAAAHEGALDVDGKTIAVVGVGIDVAYPSRHEDLFARIARRGAVVSIEQRGTTPDAFGRCFLRRNAIIAALADHVVMTCAPVDSGARNTMRHARDLKRPRWVVPGAPWDVATEGLANECVSGSATQLIGPQPIIHALGIEPGVQRSFLHPNPDETVGGRVEREVGPRPLIPRPNVRRPRGSAPPRHDPASILPAPRRTLETCESILPSADERNVVEALRQGPVGIDELVLRTGLGVASLRGLLLTWTVEGVVREGPAGLFRLATY